MKKRICIISLIMIILGATYSILSNRLNAATKYYTESKTGVNENNFSENDYSKYYHASIIESYLDKNSDGTLQKVQFVFDKDNINNSKVLIEKYDSSFNYISAKEIKYELLICGGFYSGEKYNFLVFGQPNYNDDDNVEVIRVVKYDKNWNRLAQCSFKAINTYIPFDAGSCRMIEKDGILYIDTCHEMYKSSDGLHHQSNMLIKINEETMQKVFIRDDVSNIGYGYVSHSFNQFIKADIDNNYIFTVDHGDAHPRGVAICKYEIGKNVPSQTANVFPISGTFGNNLTGVTVGGVEISSTSVIIAGNSVKQNENTSSDSDYRSKRNIFVTITNKNNVSKTNTQVKWLTNYSANGDVQCNTPHLVKITNNQFVVMWEEVTSTNTTVKAIMIDANGNNLSNTITFGGRLSDCNPIVYNNKLTWSVTTGEKVIFFAIEMENAAKFEKYNNQGVIDYTKFEHFDYKYNAEKGQYTLSNFDNKVSSITLPVALYPWTSIELASETFKNSTAIKTVNIPEGYTIVPSGCFYSAKNLEKVTLPNTLKEIGEMSFLDTKISSLTIPDSVTKIGRVAFASMAELKDITLSKNITEISQQLFSGDSLLESINIPSKVEKIGSSAFSSTGLRTITIPNSVKEIGYNAFSSCDKLRGTITIPSSVTTMVDGVFNYDDNIEKLIVKNTSATIGTKVLNNEKMMVVGEKYKATEGIKFASTKSSNENVTVSSDGTITAVKAGTATVDCLDNSGNVLVSTWVRVFDKKTPITKLELEKNVAYLKKGETITISTTYSPRPTTDYTGIKWTSSNANVAKVNSLGKITALANGTATITAICEANNSIKATCKIEVANSFAGKYEYKILDNGNIKITKYMGGTATTIAIPSNIDGHTVVELGDYIFAEPDKADNIIRKITIPETVTTLGSAFSYCKALEELTIPKSVTTITQGFANYCDKLKAINVNAGNKNYKSINGVLYESYYSDKYRLKLYPSGKQDKVFTVPEEAILIDGWSFNGNSYLQELRCLKNVTNIAMNAVKDMPNLSKVYVLNSSTFFATAYAPPFYNCPNMTIYGMKDSTAQTYAKDANFKFQAIDYKITSLKPEKGTYNFTATNVYENIKVQYEPELATNTTFEYSSSDTKVATVDSYGRIRAVGNGTAKVTVKATDGSNKTTTINVNVEIKCSSIRIYNKPSGDITSKAYVTAYAIPMNAKNTTLKYSIKDTKIATVSQSGVITPVSKGSTELYIETTDGTNIKETIPITVNVETASEGEDYLLGDVNNDKKVNLIDYTKILAHVKRTSLLTGKSLKAADVNKDGKVNLVDYTKVLAHVKRTALLW